MRRWLVVAILPLLAVTTGVRVEAEIGGGSTAGDSVAVDRGSIAAEVSSSGVAYSSGRRGASGTANPCPWRRATERDLPALAELVVQPRQRLTRPNPKTGETEIAYVRLCRDGGRIFRWAPQAPDLDALIAGAHDRVRRAVPAPIPAINPPGEVGSFVNLGLWLAVADHPPVAVTASLGSVWATVEATRATTTFDLGNGDAVTCAGSGTPIVDPAIVEQGPCGYTYRAATPLDQPLTITVASTWTTSYTTSTGRRGTLAPIVTATSLPYRVREVQTIGIEG